MNERFASISIGVLLFIRQEACGTAWSTDDLNYMKPQTIMATSSLIDYGANNPTDKQISVRFPASLCRKMTTVLKKEDKYLSLTCEGKIMRTLGKVSLPLQITSMETIPNLFTINGNGSLIFAEPEPMCKIRTPMGYNAWVTINLQTVEGHYSDQRKYLALEVKHSGLPNYSGADLFLPDEDEQSEKNRSYTRMPISDADTLELAPIISKKDMMEYFEAVKAGSSANNENCTLIPAVLRRQIDFTSLYKIEILSSEDVWLKNEPCNLPRIYGGETAWLNRGSLVVRPIREDANSKQISNQLVMISNSGQIAYSSDGIFWKPQRNLGVSGSYFVSAYGNGKWCIAGDCTPMLSTDGINWKEIDSECLTSHVDALGFGGNKFIALRNESGKSEFYQSLDGLDWQELPHKNSFNEEIRTICYGNGKWICSTANGNVYGYSVKQIQWNKLVHRYGFGLENMAKGVSWTGMCYSHGHFYAVADKGIVVKSENGADWFKIADLDSSIHWNNITAYNSGLYLFSSDGASYSAAVLPKNGNIAPES